MTPTEEQTRVIKAICDTDDNLLIRAYAGCAKTTTMLHAIAPNGILNAQFSSSLLLAFAKANEQDFRAKLGLSDKGPTVPAVKTINALGYGLVRHIIGSFPKVEGYKLENLLDASASRWNVTDEDKQEVLDEVRSARNSGIVPKHIAAKRRLGLPDDLSPPAQALLAASVTASFQGLIDFDDQIYLPAFFGSETMLENVLPSLGVKTVFVDEAQDFSEMNIFFLRQLRAQRIVVIGDPQQSIYGFRGAKDGAMEALLDGTEYKTLTLSESFRVPHTLSERYKHYAIGFRSHASLPQGSYEELNQWNTDDIVDGSAILCRNNAPLLSLCFRLITSGRSATIRGRDIGITLANLLKKICLRTLDVAAVSDWQFKEVQKFPKRIESINDKAECLIAFIHAFAPNTDSRAAQDMLRQLFQNNQARIVLSSGHKAKGLEWPVVYHLDSWRIARKTDPNDLPAMKQENNLRYVIETRAKERLVMINMNGFKKTETIGWRD